MESPTRAEPTVRKTANGIGFTSGCRSITVPQRKHTGRAPFGGCRTTAGPQQQSGQRNRGMAEERVEIQAVAKVNCDNHLETFKLLLKLGNSVIPGKGRQTNDHQSYLRQFDAIWLFKVKSS